LNKNYLGWMKPVRTDFIDQTGFINLVGGGA
jgi:hypothetical protein